MKRWQILETVQNGEKRNEKRNEPEGRKHRKIKGFWTYIPNIPEIPKKIHTPENFCGAALLQNIFAVGICFCSGMRNFGMRRAETLAA